MAEKKKRGFIKRSYAYARDYTITPNGEIRYHGILYEFLDPDCAVCFKRFAIQSGIAAALMLLCGLLPVVSMRFSAFVIFPYGIDLLSSFVLLVACIRLVRVPSPMERRMFDTSYARLLPCSAIVAIASVIAFFGHLVYLLTHLYLGVLFPDIVFGIAMAIAAAVGVLIFLGGKKIRIKSYYA